MKKGNQEIMEVEAEEMLPEIPLEKVIEDKLIKANITDLVINQLKEKYGDMKLESVDDKSGYLDIKEARKTVRKVGIITEDLCKRGRESAVKEQRLWLAKQNEILDKISKVQDPLDAEIKKFDDEVERKEIAAKIQREEVFMGRQAQLLKYGATYNNGSFELGHISYEVELIKQSDEDMWNDTILPKYRKVFEEKEIEIVAEEDKKKEEAAKLKSEQDKFAEEQIKFKEQKDLFEKQKKELEDQKSEQEKKQREDQEKIQAEQRRKKNEMLDKRMEQLRSLGMTFNFTYDTFVFEDVNVDNKTEICLFNEQEWEELIEKITPVIEERKEQKDQSEKREEIFKTRYSQLELLSVEPEIGLDLASFTDEEWDNKYIEYKKEYEGKREKALQEMYDLKKKKEDEQRQLELDAANDKTRYADVVRYLSACPTYEMKSNIYKGKMNIIKDFIADLK